MSTAEAIGALQELGLTEYEARCFVALTQLSDGTAKEISQVADIPQSRVYDVTDQLHQRGLLDVQESDPRRYFALPVEQALERLDREYDAALEAADRELTRLESRETDTEAVWEIASHDDVVIRMTMQLGDATDEIYLVLGDEDLLEPDVLDALDAVDDDVTVHVEVPSDAVRTRIHEVRPRARVAVTDLPLDSLAVDDRRPGRLLLVDDETVLLTTKKEGLVPGETEESGVWGSDLGHGLVTWIRSFLHDRRDRIEFERGTDT